MLMRFHYRITVESKLSICAFEYFYIQILFVCSIVGFFHFGFFFWLVITEFNICLIIRSPSLFFNEYLLEAKRSAFFHARTYHAWFRLRISRILFAAKHSWMTLRMTRPLFVGSYLQVTWWAFSQ